MPSSSAELAAAFGFARQVDDAVILQVTDHGIGIPEDEIGTSLREVLPGTTARDAGIRARVWVWCWSSKPWMRTAAHLVESEPVSGARFTVTLPGRNRRDSPGADRLWDVAPHRSRWRC